MNYPDPTTYDTPRLLAEVTGLPVADAALLAHDGLRAAAMDTAPALERMTPHQRHRLRAALELGQRLTAQAERQDPTMRTPEDAARLLLPLYSTRPVETFGILALDVRRRLIRDCPISVGCLTSSLVHPREVFRAAIVARAAGIILYHNHPSGDPEPSAEDVGLTRRLAQGGTLLGIEVLDHIIVGAGRFVSLKQRGCL